MNTNVILITIDCLRGDHLSCNGYRKKTTPFLDELSKKCVNFSQAISTGCWTAPSFISILTSTYPLMYNGYVSMTKQRLSIAEILKDNGYICAGFPFHPFMAPIYNYNRGFHFYRHEPEKINKKSIISKKINKALKKKIKQRCMFSKSLLTILDGYGQLTEIYRYIFLYDSEKMRAESINNVAIKWVKSQKDKKFFLWLHYFDVHSPHLPPLNYLNHSLGKLDISKLHFKRNFAWKYNSPKIISKRELEYLISLYDSNITYVDDQIRHFLQQLNQVIDLKNTYVIITADHGEQFLEHGGLEHELQLYEELIHVPLTISGPGLPSKNIEIPVSLIDLAPTILDLLDIESPPDFVGLSLLPIINSDNPQPRICFSEEGREFTTESLQIEPGKIKLNLNYKTVSLRGKKWKYIYKEGRKDELYNLKDDPGEKYNLIDSEKEIAKELKTKIDEHLLKEKKISNGRGKLLQKINLLKRSGKI